MMITTILNGIKQYHKDNNTSILAFHLGYHVRDQLVEEMKELSVMKSVKLKSANMVYNGIEVFVRSDSPYFIGATAK